MSDFVSTFWSNYVAFFTAAGIAGCALPDYHLPHGFSSSYYRHLQRGQPTMVSPPIA